MSDDAMPFVLMCYVDEAHKEQPPIITSEVGWQDAEDRAHAAGWTQNGSAQWVCADCATDPEPVRLFEIEVVNVGHGPVFDDPLDLGEHLRDLFDGEDDDELRVVVTSKMTTRGEVNLLGEFGGY